MPMHLIHHRGGILSIGGPFLIYYVTPTEEELFKAWARDQLLQTSELMGR